MNAPAVQFAIDPEALRPLIAAVVTETLTRLESDRAKVDGKLCFSEAEAAAVLGVGQHVLRDERRRGRIAASKIVGSRIRYTRDDLVGYLAGRRCPLT